MIRIKAPQGLEKIKDYSVFVLFKEILDIPYELEYSRESHWELQCPAGVVTIPDLLRDDFSAGAIPGNVPFLELPHTPERDIPGIFHGGEFSQAPKRIDLPVDIFASSFFMLSRWEEIAQPGVAPNGRWSAKHSLAYKKNFLHRPVVNEYAHWLRNCFYALGYESVQKKSWELIPTHDVDMIRFSKLKRYAGDILKQRSLQRAKTRWSLRKENPWNCFDWLMDLSESAGLRSRFYILPGGTAKMDRDFSLKDPLAKKIIARIKERNHILGIHPSFSSALNASQWQKEKQRLENQIGQAVQEGRQHYLRWDHRVTPALWESSGMIVDSTLGYHDAPGYRCGTGSTFTLFDLKNRKMRSLKEQPLVLMDGTIRDYLQEGPQRMLKEFQHYRNLSEKYSMKLTILFHNSSFDPIGWANWAEVYEEMLHQGAIL